MQFNEDTYYIEKVLHGDVHSFTPLVDKYKRMAYTLALKIVIVPEDAEEIAQDAFVKVFHALKDFKGDSKFSTWLYKIVYHTALSKIRKVKHEVSSIDENYYTALNVPETDDFFAQLTLSEQQVLVRNAIERLPADERAFITLYYMNESSIKEISLISGDSESNIKVKLFRARKKLWDLLHYHFKDKIFA